jgi:hypothetical protein
LFHKVHLPAEFRYSAVYTRLHPLTRAFPTLPS